MTIGRSPTKTGPKTGNDRAIDNEGRWQRRQDSSGDKVIANEKETRRLVAIG